MVRNKERQKERGLGSPPHNDKFEKDLGPKKSRQAEFKNPKCSALIVIIFLFSRIMFFFCPTYYLGR